VRKRHRRGLIVLLFVAAGVARSTPLAAQPVTGSAPTGPTVTGTAPTGAAPGGPVPGVAAPTGTTPAGATPTGATPAAVPNGTIPTGSAPDVLPPAPTGAFGLPNPLAPPNALPNGITPAAPSQPPYSLVLPAPGAGITPLQAYNPNAPAVLIQPTATLGETLYDNVNYVPSPRTAAAETRLIPGVSISADTPRLQGVMSAQAEGDFYTPTSNFDQITANVYANATGTIVPDHLFVDLQSLITQGATLPGLGFINPNQLPLTQQTQIYTNTISPYVRESYDGLVDTELRYRFGSTNFGGNTLTTSPTLTPAQTNLASGILNEGTFTAATGRDFTRGMSRLTVDASSFNSNSTSRNTQFSGFDDLQYQITPGFAALGRIGYQNIQYPLTVGANFAGPTWLAGGRLSIGPNYGFVSLEYGVQQGVHGFTGAAFVQITPTITFTANLVQGINSPAEFLQTSLAGSTLSPYGSIIDQNLGLPTSFYLSGSGLTNGVYREHLFNGQLSDSIGPNTYTVYGYYSSQASLTPPVTAPTTSVGASVSWARDIRPNLNGYTSFGYANTANAVTPTTLTLVSGINTFSANVGLNYLFARSLTGSILYTFSYEPNGGAVIAGRSGDVVANSLQLLLTKAF
jgi:uncharacterized protein (PEP-CTERM system associated)